MVDWKIGERERAITSNQATGVARSSASPAGSSNTATFCSVGPTIPCISPYIPATLSNERANSGLLPFRPTRLQRTSFAFEIFLHCTKRLDQRLNSLAELRSRHVVVQALHLGILAHRNGPRASHLHQLRPKSVGNTNRDGRCTHPNSLDKAKVHDALGKGRRDQDNTRRLLGALVVPRFAQPPVAPCLGVLRLPHHLAAIRAERRANCPYDIGAADTLPHRIDAVMRAAPQSSTRSDAWPRPTERIANAHRRARPGSSTWSRRSRSASPRPISRPRHLDQPKKVCRPQVSTLEPFRRRSP